ncbi:MAG: hypothetical protein J6K16_05350 [Alphaproteobacteria bacterium]|nr:hypothetical protein [Alphaproteobacteria bacterium]
MLKSEALSVISEFQENKDLSFNQALDFYKKLQEIVAEYPEYSEYVAPAVAYSSGRDFMCADIMPTAVKTFEAASKNLSNEEICNNFDLAMKQSPRFALSFAENILKDKPELAEYIFRKTMDDVDNTDSNGIFRYKRVAVKCVEQSKENASAMLSEVMQHPKLKNEVYLDLSKIYIAHPELSEQIFRELENPEIISSKYGSFYANLADIAVCNIASEEPECEGSVFINMDEPQFDSKEDVDRAIGLIEKYIVKEDNNSASLNTAFSSLGKIMVNFPSRTQKIKDIIATGLEHPNNNSVSKKTAWRATNDYEKLRSSVSYYERGEKTDDCPYGIKSLNEISPDDVCVLVLGGDGVRGEKEINGYMSSVYQLLKDNDLEQDVKVCGVVYDFGDFYNQNQARTKMMEKYHRSIKMDKKLSEDTINPKYVKDIFDRLILPRISKTNGTEKLDAEDAAQKIRKLNIVAHCHGAYTALMLEEMMQQKMQELGYNKEDREYIQKQMLVVAQSPYCPLGVSKSTFVSFFSSADMETSHYNNFERAVQSIRKSEKIPLSYFPGNRGELFLAHEMGEGADEHNYWGLQTNSAMSEDGANLIKTEARVLVNGVEGALSRRPIEDVSFLAATDEKSEKLMEQMTENGEKLYRKMCAISMAVAKHRAEYE